MNDNTAAGAPTAEAGPADDTAPPVPAEIEEAARLAPDHWLGMVDPAWSGEGEPPDWAVVGQWRSGLDGEIEEWRANEEYRPSPQALGWPAPTDAVDEAVQLAATGYGPGEAVPRALAVAEVALLLGPGGVPLSATSPDGASVVPVFTSPTYLHAAGRFGYELTPVTQVVDRIPEGHVLYLNPSGPVGMTVESDALRQAVEAAAREARDGKESERPSAPSRSSTAGGAEVPKRPVAEPSAGARGQDPAPGLDN
ncbi:type VII secretion system-associated protein [Streptomyces sp. NPDC088116]|uniref:type VII secretion system-associated protein n=1 Tax=Streptomyces sp. NPDC088116 TaxID=3365825 RepID=UPI0038084034